MLVYQWAEPEIKALVVVVDDHEKQQQQQQKLICQNGMPYQQQQQAASNKHQQQYLKREKQKFAEFHLHDVIKKASRRQKARANGFEVCNVW